MQRPLQIVDSARIVALKALRAAAWGLLAAALLLIVIALFQPVAHAQISPGPLSKFHRDLEGPSGCTRCHAVSAGSPSFRCLDCHTEIASRLRERRGLHPAIMNPSDGNAACARCHSEHNGENFILTKWNPTPGSYDHSKTGFTLDGKHAGLSCNKCHNPQRIVPAERQTLAGKNIARTFLGLSRSCVTCHEDKHRGQLGANCIQCHNTTDWKSSRNTFDHSKTKFALRGAHVDVACQKCHAPQQDGTPKYVGLKFDRCSACHADPHKAAFPQQTCEDCHTVSGWKQTQKFRASFDHSRTKFPLLGKHVEVGCQQCHRRADFKTAVTHDLCADCHKPDPHNGQFAKRADGGRCESCHTVDGFKTKVKFALVEHNATGFPLRGKHAEVECAKCHTPRGRATLFKIKFKQCLDCHKDIHGGQFARAPYMNRCEQCHTEQSFHPATFTLAKHQKSAFVLTGGHMAVACADCHKPTDVTKAASAVFHFQTVACTSCHSDPHRNQFATRMAEVSANGRAVGCEACHSTKQWNDLQRFDHERTNFALTGTHRAVECAACHRPPNLERKLLNVNFKSVPSKCEGCHEDPHGAQFTHLTLAALTGTAVPRSFPGAGSEKQGPLCADCHNTNKWRPSSFDHEKTAFSLRGAHAQVRCNACHVVKREVNDRPVLFYRPTPTTCAACHGSKVAPATGL